MRKIPVTRNFDRTRTIGYLMLVDGEDILPDEELVLGYTILEGTPDHPTKIQVLEISLTPTPVQPKLRIA